LIAAILPEVLARTAFDANRLIAPGGTTARIHPADVFELVRQACGTFDFDGLAVGDVWHSWLPLLSLNDGSLKVLWH